MALLVALGSFGAGLLGALTGLGGGIVVVPMLTLLFHVDLRYAIGASLVSVIATSSGAASAYVREGYTNVRIGIFLEVATTIGALASAGVYLHRGYIEPEIAFPVMLGVLAGALLGARVLARARTEWLRRLFTIVVAVLAVEMLYKGLTGGL